MQFYFIRHGQSSNNALYAQTGSSQGRSDDPELTEIGRLQALYLSRFLGDAAQSGVRLTHLYSSPMVRAVDTALAVSTATGVPVIAWVDFHETGGIFLDQVDLSTGSELKVKQGLPGKTRQYFQQHYPDLVLPPNLDGQGWWNRPFEEPAERPLRARRVLQELLRRHPVRNGDGSEDCVAVVSHGGFYNHFLRQVIGLPPRHTEEDDQGIWFSIRNTGITRIDFLEDHLIVQYQNRNHFLPPELVS